MKYINWLQFLLLLITLVHHNIKNEIQYLINQIKYPIILYPFYVFFTLIKVKHKNLKKDKNRIYNIVSKLLKDLK